MTDVDVEKKDEVKEVDLDVQVDVEWVCRQGELTDRGGGGRAAGRQTDRIGQAKRNVTICDAGRN